ncbi:glycoside hydrolase family 3 protein [Paracoccus sp. (in: a-proteobacteria)]|uniref:glycoside hydrolase family 3 protein n=1 Tax=Paracoccus sp. TaxID=267 RepID=UPI002AFFCD61|nr:glycoside hydrolase family 3 N-terminal domain-containing protein [Paracoccus sp. (in: a-proteobacteria)]
MATRFADALERLRKATIRALGEPRARLRRLWRAARAVLGFGRGMLGYPAAWFGLFRPRDELAAAVAELLVVGFYGSNSRSSSARLLARQVHRGQVGGVFFVAQNIGPIDELTDLMRLFRAGGNQPLIAIDHEGGIVQRLTKAHGVTRLPAARTVAATLSPTEARQLYAGAGQELAALGFNINLGPVLDVDDPANPVIGRPKRSYGTDPERIAAYAEAFASGFASAGILCTAKHFPGHGRSVSDSHHGVADISAHWTEAELEPFVRLFASPHAPAMVMMGHLRLDRLAPDGRPATVSAPIVTGLLRQKFGYKGVVMTDDVDMDAIRHLMSRREAVVQALAAGNDLIMIKNLFGYDPLLPQRAVRWVRKAIAQGTLTEAQITAAVTRVRAIRRQAWQGRA